MVGLTLFKAPMARVKKLQSSNGDRERERERKKTWEGRERRWRKRNFFKIFIFK